jgi:RNA polymerase sigma factor (sigma-70 family)
VAVNVDWAERSCEELYRQYSRDVLGYAYELSRNTHDAQDLAQVTFLNAYRALRRGYEPDVPRLWLRRIALNAHRERARTQARRPMEVPFPSDFAALAPASSSGAAERLREAIAGLGPVERSVLVKRELEGRSYDEIAADFGITRAAVAKILFRARRVARERLDAAVTCEEARANIEREGTAELTDQERAALRGHLRSCQECAFVARSRRARRGRGLLLLIPLPDSFSRLLAAMRQLATVNSPASSGVALKAAAMGVAGLGAAGLGAVAIHHYESQPHTRLPAAPAVAPRQQVKVHVKHAPRPARPHRTASVRRPHRVTPTALHPTAPVHRAAPLFTPKPDNAPPPPVEPSALSTPAPPAATAEPAAQPQPEPPTAARPASQPQPEPRAGAAPAAHPQPKPAAAPPPAAPTRPKPPPPASASDQAGAQQNTPGSEQANPPTDPGHGNANANGNANSNGNANGNAYAVGQTGATPGGNANGLGNGANDTNSAGGNGNGNANGATGQPPAQEADPTGNANSQNNGNPQSNPQGQPQPSSDQGQGAGNKP